MLLGLEMGSRILGIQWCMLSDTVVKVRSDNLSMVKSKNVRKVAEVKPTIQTYIGTISNASPPYGKAIRLYLMVTSIATPWPNESLTIRCVKADGQGFPLDVPEEFVDGKGRARGGTRHQCSQNVGISGLFVGSNIE